MLLADDGVDCGITICSSACSVLTELDDIPPFGGICCC